MQLRQFYFYYFTFQKSLLAVVNNKYFTVLFISSLNSKTSPDYIVLLYIKALYK